MLLWKPSEFSSVKRKYRRSDSLFEVDSQSPVYWVQEIEDERYELIFGDGVFGKPLQEPNFIEVKYLVNNGFNGNGVSDFSFNGKLTTSRDNIAINTGISVSLLTHHLLEVLILKVLSQLKSMHSNICFSKQSGNIN